MEEVVKPKKLERKEAELGQVPANVKRIFTTAASQSRALHLQA